MEFKFGYCNLTILVNVSGLFDVIDLNAYVIYRDMAFNDLRDINALVKLGMKIEHAQWLRKFEG